MPQETNNSGRVALDRVLTRCTRQGTSQRRNVRVRIEGGPDA
jgi:hypothetical protein